jgi:hypothetical protein
MADKPGFLATFRIEKKIWDKFRKIAQSNRTNASALLLGYIESVIAAGDIPQNKSYSPHPCIDADIDAAIKKLIANSLEDGAIGEKIDDCYQSMMVHLNEVQSQIYALKQEMLSKSDDISEKSSIAHHPSPVTNDQSPITNDQSPITNDQSPVTSPQPPITRSLSENIRTSLKRKGINASTEKIRAAFAAAGWNGSNYHEIRKDILDRLS